jgi:hypothetical protein
VLPSLGVFSLAGSFRCLFLLLFVGALYVAWVLFYVGLFSVRTFFFSTRTTTTLTTLTSVVGDICFDACFSQLEPSPLRGRQAKKNRLLGLAFRSSGIVLGKGIINRHQILRQWALVTTFQEENTQR